MIVPQPAPRTVEDLKQEVSEDSLLTQLEKQQAAQEEAIRTYKADTAIVGLPAESPQDSEVDESGGTSDPDADYSSGEDLEGLEA